MQVTVLDKNRAPVTVQGGVGAGYSAGVDATVNAPRLDGGSAEYTVIVQAQGFVPVYSGTTLMLPDYFTRPYTITVNPR